MVWAALLYASLGTWLALRIGAPLVRLNFDLQRYEADFRLSMARVHDNAESIALTRGEANERVRFRERFTRILRTYWAIMRRQKRLSAFTWIYGQLALVFPLLVAAPRYFARQIMLGGLMQTAQAFGQVQGALSFIVNSYPDIARWRAAVDRLVGFERALRSPATRANAGAPHRGPARADPRTACRRSRHRSAQRGSAAARPELHGAPGPLVAHRGSCRRGQNDAAARHRRHLAIRQGPHRDSR